MWLIDWLTISSFSVFLRQVLVHCSASRNVRGITLPHSNTGGMPLRNDAHVAQMLMLLFMHAFQKKWNINKHYHCFKLIISINLCIVYIPLKYFQHYSERDNTFSILIFYIYNLIFTAHLNVVWWVCIHCLMPTLTISAIWYLTAVKPR